IADLEKLLAKYNADMKDPIHLPSSQMARSLGQTTNELLSLALSQDGKLHVPGRDTPLGTVGEVRDYVKGQFRGREAKGGPGTVQTPVMIRPDRKAEAGTLCSVARLCIEQGFSRVLLQVVKLSIKEGKEEGKLEDGLLELVVPHWRRPDSF